MSDLPPPPDDTGSGDLPRPPASDAPDGSGLDTSDFRFSGAWAKFRSWPTWVQVVCWVFLAIILIGISNNIAGTDSDETASSDSTTTAQEPATTTTGEPETTATEAPTTTEAPADNETAALPEGCELASEDLLSTISSGLTVTGGGTLSKGVAVRSDDFEKVWFVAAEIDGSGMEGEGEVGVWATNELDGTGSIFAIDAMATEFSDWGVDSNNPDLPTMSDDGAEEAVDCLEEAA